MQKGNEMTTTAEEILEAMRASAADGVASSAFSAGSSSQSSMSVQDQIAAYRFAKEVGAKSSNHGGIMFRQFIPPGARNDS